MYAPFAKALLVGAAIATAACTGPTMNAPGEPIAEGDTVTVDGFLQIAATGGSIGEATADRIQRMAWARGPVGIVRGLVTAPKPGSRVNGVVQALSMAGVEPVVMVEPEATAIEITVFRTVPPGCADWANARIPYPTDSVGWNRNPYPSDELALGCTLNVSLDAMVADPRDLSDPPAHMSAAHAAGLAAASERYRTTGPRPLPARTAPNAAF